MAVLLAARVQMVKNSMDRVIEWVQLHLHLGHVRDKLYTIFALMEAVNITYEAV